MAMYLPEEEGTFFLETIDSFAANINWAYSHNNNINTFLGNIWPSIMLLACIWNMPE
jgi:hypothetical protein